MSNFVYTLPNRSKAHYEQKRLAWHADCRPADGPEAILVDQVAESRWYLDRITAVESSAIIRALLAAPRQAPAIQASVRFRSEVSAAAAQEPATPV